MGEAEVQSAGTKMYCILLNATEKCVHVYIWRQFICMNATDKHGGVAVTRANTLPLLWLSHVAVVIWFIPNCTQTIGQL